MYQDAVKVPTSEATKKRRDNLTKNDVGRKDSGTKSGFSRDMSKCVTDKDLVLPDNVLHFATVTTNVGHPAAYPLDLPLWFIKLFTQRGDWVLDHICGIVTSGVAARKLRRNFVLIDKEKEYIEIAKERIRDGKK